MSRGRRAAPLDVLAEWYREQLGEETSPTGGVSVVHGSTDWREAYDEDQSRGGADAANKVRLRWPYSESPSSAVVTRYRRRSYVDGVRVTPAQRREALLPPTG